MCVYVYVCVCVSVCVPTALSVCVCVCVCVCVSVCVCVCVCVCVHCSRCVCVLGWVKYREQNFTAGYTLYNYECDKKKNIYFFFVQNRYRLAFCSAADALPVKPTCI